MSIHSRRDFLCKAARVFGAASAGLWLERLGLVHLMAQSSNDCSDYKALVCVFLFGGNDATNTIVPIEAVQSYSEYARIRGPLALPQVQLLPIQPRDGGSIFGLHPRLSPLQPLYQQGRLAVVLNVGTLLRPTSKEEYTRPGAAVPDNLFSHSDQTSQWQTSTPSSRTPTGWGGRLADRVQECNAPVSFPMVLSVSGNTLFGDGDQTRLTTLTPNAAMGLQGFSQSSSARYSAYRRLLELDGEVALARAANSVAAAGLKDAELVNKVLAVPSRITTAFPTTTIGQQLRTVARLIEGRAELGLRRQVFFCSLGGFDTHQNQLGTHDSLLNQLAPALAAFYEATVELGASDRVTTFTASEFSRTVQPNSTNGSDHGWGAHHFVLGGAVKGGDLYGRYPNLALSGPDDANVRGVFIPSTALDQYNASLASWFGAGAQELAAVFPNLANFSSANLGFML